jgi:hypothetical protein
MRTSVIEGQEKFRTRDASLSGALWSECLCRTVSQLNLLWL